MLYLVVEHQRQAGQADDQQERRTDQAGPFVDHIPGFDGGGGGHGMGTAEAARPSGVSVDWKRNSITNNSYSRSVLCGAGHSRALACRGRAGGRQRAVSKRVKSKFGGAVRMASARRPRRSPCLSATLEHHAAAFPQNPSQRLRPRLRGGRCMGIFPPASEPGSVGFRSGARPLFSVGDLVDRGRRTNRCWTGCGSPGSTRCKAITRTTRSTTSAAAKWTR